MTSLVRGDLLDLTPASYDRVMATNLRGTFFLTQAAAHRMVAAPANGPRSIAPVGSINAEIVGENRGDSRSAPASMRTAMTAPAEAKYDAFIAAGGVPAAR